MTNTTQPMTFDEWYKQFETSEGVNLLSEKRLLTDYILIRKSQDSLLASEANQQDVISEKDKQIAELVEALEMAREMVGHKDNIALIDGAIAKVKGK